YKQAEILRNLGNYEKALESINKLLIKTKQEIPVNSALILKASLYYLSDELNESKKILLEVIGNQKKLQDKLLFAKAFVNLGIIEDDEGNFETARKYFNKALKISDEINNPEIKALAYSELGVSYSYTGELIDAKNSYLKSIEYFESLNNKVRLSYLYSNLGRIYQNYYSFTEAFDAFQKGEKLAGENKSAKIQNLIGLADISLNLSNYAQALEYYNKANKLSSEIKTVSLKTEIDYGLGSLNYNLNRPISALNYFYKVEKEYSYDQDYYGLADVYDKIGLVYYKLDSLELAEKYFKEAIKNSETINNNYASLNSYLNLANIYLESNPVKAKKILSEIRIPHDDAYTDLLSQKFLITGKIECLQMNFVQALKYFQKADEIAESNNLKETQIEINFEEAKTFEMMNDLPNAESKYLQAIELIQNSSNSIFGNDELQIGYLSEKIKVYYSLAGLFNKTGRYELAMETIENGRARNTSQHIKNLGLRSAVKDKLKLNKLIELDWAVNSDLYYDQKDSLLNELDKTRWQILKENPNSGMYLDQKRNITLKEYQSELKKNEFALSLYLSDSVLYTYVLGKNSFNHYWVKISTGEIQNELAQITPYLKENSILQNSLVNQDLFAFNAVNSNKFYNLILKKALEKIPRESTLIFSLPPELSGIPFELFVTDFSKYKSPYIYKNAEFLISDYNISYTSSFNNFFLLNKGQLKSSDIALLMGDPAIENNLLLTDREELLSDNVSVVRNINLFPLKYSKDEILQIDNSIGASHVFLSDAATESVFKKYSSSSRIIHLSTHSFLNKMQPVIFFSNKNDKENDGLLELGEIMNLKLDCDLVVLSSCNSGRGITDKAEGILGMTKAFLGAGAKSVVVSLWDVNDKYTSILMSSFYKNLADGMNKPAALRNAKLEMIRNYSPNPYFWAAFTLNGNTDGMKINAAKSYLFYLVSSIFLLITVFIVLSLRKKFAVRKFFIVED
ncbi:MAG: CHAT domain-containing protein, partial [Ignavibacteriales bacterium]